MLKEPKDFQLATANRILEVFQGGQKRVLLADEVGLGKTVVASKVIKLVGEWHRTDPNILDDHFKVVYVCSNANIANQNAHTLGVDDTLDISESRLSMQHLSIYQKAGKDHAYEQLIPLTPSTSFSMTLGCGNKRERALLYVLLNRLDCFADIKQRFSRFMRMNVENGWEEWIKEYENQVINCDANGSNYLEEMNAALKDILARKENSDIIPSILKILEDKRSSYICKESKILVNRLRRIFAEISLAKMDPDLVIMDEFQRFRNLIDESDDNSETNMLVKKFFGNPNTKILLLSATPYKPYSTLEELNENNVDEQYQDFLSLMKFLHTEGEDKSKYEKFQQVWESYSKNLSQMDGENFTILKASKNKAEDAMYRVMCRTERINTGIVDDSKALEIPIKVGDILSYNQLQRIMDASYDRDLKKKNNRAHTYKVPIEYIKSTPFVLSFTDDYDLKKHLFEKSFKDDEFALLDFVKKHRKYMLTQSNIYNYNELDSNNARLEYLKKLLFEDSQSECLLWVPASHPYYKNVGGVFERNKDFSKILIFSAWAMVPRMLATLLSYEAERLTIGKRRELTYEGKRGVKYGFQNEHGKAIVKFVSPKIAELYNPQEYYGWDLKDVSSAIRRKVNELLDSVAQKYSLERQGNNTAIGMHRLLFLIEDRDYTEEFEDNNSRLSIPDYAADVLTNVAIASPASCFYRIFKKEKNRAEIAEECAEEFVTMFNRRESAAAIYKINNRKDDSYYEYVLDYCVKGNLQAVLDEYAFMIGKEGEELKRELLDGFVGGESSLQIDTYTPTGRAPFRMRTHYALSYANTKLDDKTISRNLNMQKVFNSPFRPFVLASTSVGQEGLDFHKYARKIMHWNLPANPVELEQREGRVNRFLNLSVRRNVAHKYGQLFDWNEMLEAAKHDYKGNDCEMVPYWYLPPKMLEDMRQEGIPVEKIERIVAMYPLSKDKIKYERLIKILTLYRLTMGQPRQEELLEMLSGLVTEEQINELLIQLSPIRHLFPKITF